MKTKLLIIYLLFSVFTIHHAQTLQLISKSTQKPLTKVSILANNGNLIGYTDIDGKIDRSLIKKEDENFTLVYNNSELSILSYQQLQKDIIPLEERIKDIETVIIDSKKASKYILIKGYFNTYVTVNNKINCYADGIITFVFENKSQKLKSANIQEYRVYRLENPNEEKKQTDTWDYNSLLKLPDVKKLGNLEEYYANKKGFNIKELITDSKTEIEITGEALQQKELSLLGYRFFDIKRIIKPVVHL